jgi:hypothetical protein
VILVAHDKPRLRALVAFDLHDGCFTDSAFVGLDLAAELAAKGYAVLVDPQDERDLAMWERLNRIAPPKRRWFDQA